LALGGGVAQIGCVCVAAQCNPSGGCGARTYTNIALRPPRKLSRTAAPSEMIPRVFIRHGPQVEDNPSLTLLVSIKRPSDSEVREE
jgi:hypothetical protein